MTKLTGVSAKTLHGWAESGMLKPSLTQSSGHGSERGYNFADLAAIYAASLARRFDVSLSALAPMVECVRAEIPNAQAVDEHSDAVVLLTTGKTVVVQNAALAKLMREADSSVLVAFGIGSIGTTVLVRLTEAELGGTLPRRRGRPRGHKRKDNRGSTRGEAHPLTRSLTHQRVQPTVRRMAKESRKVPITMRALIQRLNRHLAREDEQIKTTRGERWRSDLGDYYAINVRLNAVTAKHVDPEQWAREADLLKSYEYVAEERGR